MHETPEGFLVCVGVPIARTGEMVYGDDEVPLTGDENGEVKITRDENEVFNKKTMASFEGKPITITHPKEFVTPENWSRLAKGIIQNVRRGEGENKNDLLADLLVTDSVAIDLIRNGLREVSCGYEANYVQDEDGKGKQTRIVGNHLALVDQGRAGSSYAINDHKRKGSDKMKFADKIKSIFAKAQDEAMKVAQDEASAEKKEDKKDDSKDALKEESPSLSVYDELKKMCDSFQSKLAELAPKSKDEKKEEKKDEAKDAEEVAASLEDRLKALEVSVAKLLERESKEDSVSLDEDKKEDEAKDSDESEELESEDEDFEESTMTGDSKSRLEILAPGMNADVKDAKVKALKKAYDTEEGKKVIDSLTGGKPTFDSAEKVETLFIAASEVLKAQRTLDLSKTKQVSLTRDSEGPFSGPMTPEKLNEINSNFWKQQA